TLVCAVPFQYAKVRVLTKQQFLGGSCCLWWDEWGLSEGPGLTFRSMSVQPATMHGATNSDGEYLISAHGFGGYCCLGGGLLEVRRITQAQNCCVSGNQTSPVFQQQVQGVGIFDGAPSASQPGTVTLVDTGDTRLQFAKWRGGLLSTGQTIGCGGLACAAYTELDVSAFPTITTVDDFTFNRPATSSF